MDRSIVVLSGGQDSATTLLEARKHTEVVACVHFRYGQRHGIEQECAKWWADKFGIPLHVIDVSALAAIGDSALIGEGDVRASHARADHLPASFVPGRNLVFLTLASALGFKLGAPLLYTGVCQTDYSGYPDCRQATISALTEALRLGMDLPSLAIVTPLMAKTKAETFRMAADAGYLEDILEHTHTCYEGDHQTRHDWGYGCGTCPSCVLREKGWHEYQASLVGTAL